MAAGILGREHLLTFTIMSKLRPDISDAAPGTFSPKSGTAYYMIFAAVQQQHGLIHGRLHDANGEHCAIGSYFTVNPKTALARDLIDEVAAVNDSVPHYSPRARRVYVMRWLRWKLADVGMAELSRALAPRVRSKNSSKTKKSRKK